VIWSEEFGPILPFRRVHRSLHLKIKNKIVIQFMIKLINQSTNQSINQSFIHLHTLTLLYFIFYGVYPEHKKHAQYDVTSLLLTLIFNSIQKNQLTKLNRIVQIYSIQTHSETHTDEGRPSIGSWHTSYPERHVHICFH
jgi:hypothetical protein